MLGQFHTFITRGSYGFIEIRFFIKVKRYTDLEILISKFSVGRYKEALTKNQVMRTNLPKTEKEVMINKIVVTRLPKQKKQSNGSLIKEREKGKMELDLWQGLDRPRKIFLLAMLAPTLIVEK